MTPSIGISKFAADRHRAGSRYTYFLGSPSELIERIEGVWDLRRPGKSRTDLDKVVVVSLSPDWFINPRPTTLITPSTILAAQPYRRREGEDIYTSVEAIGEKVLVSIGSPPSAYEKFHFQELVGNVPHYYRMDPCVPEKCNFAQVVLYSKEALLENGGDRSTDCDWEVVSMSVSPVEDEPMDPLTMARNLLKKPGGTYAPHTAEELAESIYYWSLRASIRQYTSPLLSGC